MLRTIEAEINANGDVTLHETLHLDGTYRAIVTILEPINNSQQQPGNTQDLVDILRKNRLPPSSKRSAEEIDAQIQAERDAWN